jgi:hypothetical protein
MPGGSFAGTMPSGRPETSGGILYKTQWTQIIFGHKVKKRI